MNFTLPEFCNLHFVKRTGKPKQVWKHLKHEKRYDPVQQRYSPALPETLSYPYLTGHSMKWSNKDVKLQAGYIALFMMSEEHDETCSHPSLLPSHRHLPERWLCLFHWHRFCAPEDSTGVQGAQSKTTHERHVGMGTATGQRSTTCSRPLCWTAEGLWGQGRRIPVWVCCHPTPPLQGLAWGRSWSAVARTFSAST